MRRNILQVSHGPDPTGLVPVVKEVEWGVAEAPRSTLASTGTRPVGGNEVTT